MVVADSDSVDNCPWLSTNSLLHPFESKKQEARIEPFPESLVPLTKREGHMSQMLCSQMLATFTTLIVDTTTIKFTQELCSACAWSPFSWTFNVALSGSVLLHDFQCPEFAGLVSAYWRIQSHRCIGEGLGETHHGSVNDSPKTPMSFGEPSTFLHPKKGPHGQRTTKAVTCGSLPGRITFSKAHHLLKAKANLRSHQWARYSIQRTTMFFMFLPFGTVSENMMLSLVLMFDQECTDMLITLNRWQRDASFIVQFCFGWPLLCWYTIFWIQAVFAESTQKSLRISEKTQQAITADKLELALLRTLRISRHKTLRKNKGLEQEPWGANMYLLDCFLLHGALPV